MAPLVEKRVKSMSVLGNILVLSCCRWKSCSTGNLCYAFYNKSEGTFSEQQTCELKCYLASLLILSLFCCFHQFQYQGKFFCSLRFLECKMSRNRRMTIGFYWTSLWSLEKLQGLHRYLIISSAHLVGIELYFVKHLLALCGSGYLRWRSTLVPYILYSSLASFMQPTGPGWGDQIQDNPAMHLLQPEGCVVACSNKFLFPNNIKPSGLDLSVKKFADSSRYISSLQIFM